MMNFTIFFLHLQDCCLISLPFALQYRLSGQIFTHQSMKFAKSLRPLEGISIQNAEKRTPSLPGVVKEPVSGQLSIDSQYKHGFGFMRLCLVLYKMGPRPRFSEDKHTEVGLIFKNLHQVSSQNGRRAPYNAFPYLKPTRQHSWPQSSWRRGTRGCKYLAKQYYRWYYGTASNCQ